jgi:hypothetical protein
MLTGPLGAFAPISWRPRCSVGTLSSSVPGDPALDAEMEVRSLTGVGAEKAVAH